jgi:putative phosphoribosyl transferase
MPSERVHELEALRDRAPVFRDRAHAGEVLAGMLEAYRGSNAVVLAVPAGGVPVAAQIASRLGLELDVAVVSKILLPWTTEAGFGAVAFDGSVWLDEVRVADFGLRQDEVRRQTDAALAKVRHRVARLRGARVLPALEGRAVIVVDDGVAAGSTLRAALAALRRAGANNIAIAVPTAHADALAALAPLADAVYCANVRGTRRYAVADAYEAWHDVDDAEVDALLAR